MLCAYRGTSSSIDKAKPEAKAASKMNLGTAMRADLEMMTKIIPTNLTAIGDALKFYLRWAMEGNPLNKGCEIYSHKHTYDSQNRNV